MFSVSDLSSRRRAHYPLCMDALDKEAATAEVAPEWAIRLATRRNYELRISQEKLAARTGDLLSQADISRIETGKKHPVFELSDPELVAYIKSLGWSVLDFMRVTELDVPMYHEINPYARVSEEAQATRDIPLYDGVGAGPGFDFGEQIGVTPIPVEWTGDFRSFVVHGDSMAPEIFDGYTVVVKMGEPAQLGNLVLAYHPDHDLIIKRLVISTETQRSAILRSKNPDYGDILVCDGCAIKGVVRRIIPKAIDV
jgi:SOS-response transcriptional repressor LexA